MRRNERLRLLCAVLFSAAFFVSAPSGAQTCEDILEQATAEAYDRGYAAGLEAGGGGTSGMETLPDLSAPLGPGGSTSGQESPWQLMLDAGRVGKPVSADSLVELLKSGATTPAGEREGAMIEAVEQLQRELPNAEVLLLPRSPSAPTR